MTRAETTRRRLLDASLAAFARNGMHDTRVDDICELAGVARATFYRHFDGKATVFNALHEEMSAEVRHAARDLDPVGPGADGFNTMRAFVCRLLAMSERWAPVISSLSTGDDVGPGVREASIELTSELARQVGRRFEEGNVKGVDPAVAAVAIIALVEGVGHQLRTWSVEVDREEVIDLLALETLMMLHPGGDGGPWQVPVAPL